MHKLYILTTKASFSYEIYQSLYYPRKNSTSYYINLYV